MSVKIKPITETPGDEELSLRLAKVRKLMVRHELDCYVVAHTDNVYYLTNFAYLPFERPFFLIVPIDGNPMLVVPLLEVSHAEQRVLINVDYHTYDEYPAPSGKTFADVLAKLIGRAEKVGLESSLAIGLQCTIPGRLTVIDIVDEVRLVKTDYEVGRIAYACYIANQGLQKVLELSQAGVQLATLYSEGTREMMVKTVLEIPDVNPLVTKFMAAVWPKAVSEQPHSVPGLFDTLEKGGPNVAVVTAQTNGYAAELERTYFLGEVPEPAKELFDLCLEARRKAFELVKPGVSGEEIDAAVRETIRRAGHDNNILHRTGHGFGITGHEPPWLALGSEQVMKKNMIISIEPAIYVAGLGGFRHSDTVRVTASGCESLTDFPDQLEDLTLPMKQA